MIIEHDIEGKIISLRTVRSEDAEFILSLRLNPELNRFINKVDNNLEKQIQWINDQKERKNDYYFIVHKKNRQPIGTISLYNIANSEGEFGRWIITGNSLEALESAILIHDFGFNTLGLNRVISKTHSENIKVINFHKRFGADISPETVVQPESGLVLKPAAITREAFPAIRKDNYEIINKFYGN